MNGQRIYLDNAATSWPKPEKVYSAVDHFQRCLGAPAGRGAYREAAEVERLVRESRRLAAELIGSAEPHRIVFTLNGTDSLNMAIHGLLRPGDHVITSVVEHNSVLRPLRWLEDRGQITVTRLGCDNVGKIDPHELKSSLQKHTRLVALTHASNVTGTVQPAAELAAITREHGAIFLLDAAQTLGQWPIDLREIQADLIAAPGHKGLLGPLGTGVLYVGSRADSVIVPSRQGGTGTESESDQQPSSLPERLESGNLNVPGILGLGAGLSEVLSRGVTSIRNHHQSLVSQLIHGIRKLAGLRIVGSEDDADRVGVVSVQIAGYDPQEIAAILDSSHQIQVRSGFHCAGLLHRQLGTAPDGGTVRFSVGLFNTAEEIDRTISALSELCIG